MMMKRPFVAALALASGLAASPFAQALCRPDNTTPFTPGPVAANGFAASVTDSEGISLQICTDSNTADGNPPPCFFDPVIAGNATSEATGFGGEGFYFLSQSTLITTGANAIDALLVGAAEAAYAAGVPAPNQQFSFTRLRIRVDVTTPGIYTVAHPWGFKTYTVTDVVDAKGKAIRREINDTVDVEFKPGVNSTGSTGSWLRWDAPVPPGFEAYIGDGVTPHTVIGSPCGQNFLRVTATTLDGRTPLAIDPTDADGDGNTAAITTKLFTVQGKLAPQPTAPLAINNAYYSRSATGSYVSVFATSPTTASLTATPGGNLVSDGNGRFFTAFSTTTVPASISVTATKTGNLDNTQTAALTDLITISRAEAVCSGSPRSCTLRVDATSSDAVGKPTLNVSYNNAALTAGTVSVPGVTVVPPSVIVWSSAGGMATQSVTVINP